MAAAPDDDARRTLAELEAKLRELERELLRGHEPAPAPPTPFGAPPAPSEAEPEPPPRAYEAAPPEGEPPAAEPPEAAPPEATAPEATPPETARPETRPFGTPPTFDVPGAEAAPPPPPAAHAFDTPTQAAPPEPGPFGAPPTFDAEPAPQESTSAEALAPEAVAPPEPEPAVDLDALHDAHELLASLRTTIEELGLTAARITTEAREIVDDHGRTLGRLERAAAAASRAERAAVEAGRLASTIVVDAGPVADAAAVRALRDTLAAQPGARDAYVRGVEDGRAVIEVHLAPPPA